MNVNTALYQKCPQFNVNSLGENITIQLCIFRESLFHIDILHKYIYFKKVLLW